MTSTEDAEARRILAENQRRERERGTSFYELTKPANLFVRHGQERALLDALNRAGLLPLAERRILEVGCGRGQWLSVFEDFGADRGKLAGIDIDAGRIEAARTRFMGADLQTGDATKLPWSDGAFELVFQSTVFTSILDASVRAAVANEMIRVCAPGGAIVWYDFRYDNPANKAVRGIAPREISHLFTDCSVELRAVTLAPPISRRLVGVSWLLATALEKLRVLNTHLIGVIKPRRA